MVHSPTQGATDAVGGIRLESVSKSFGSVLAVDSVSLEVRAGEFFSLLGPSGCGKTTLLRIIAGFEQPSTGRVLVDGRDVTLLAPQKRPTAMVFQNYALFPTMTVRQNVEYGLRVRKVARDERRRIADEVLERVDMSEFGSRPVTSLSGGQQQRVAVARALSVRPHVLLFDEPLSNLDAGLRERTRAALRTLQESTGKTSLYVTHDQEEALAISDRIAVMSGGRVMEVGTPRALYESPGTEFVARFLGGANVVRDASVIAGLLPDNEIRNDRVLAVRPEHLVPSDRPRALPVTVLRSQFLGSRMEIDLGHEDTVLRMRHAADGFPGAVTAVEAIRWTWVQPSASRLE